MTRRPGPPPMPPELRMLRGNPGHRPTPDAPPAVRPAAIPRPPADLGERGREAWDRYWTAGAAWLSVADFEAISRLCGLIERAAAIAAAVDDEGLTIRNRRTGRSAVHASFNSLLGLYKSISDLERQLGIPPTERSRVTVTRSQDDDVARWMASGND